MSDIEKILTEFGKVIEEVAIAGVKNPVGYKPTHLWKPAYQKAEQELKTYISNLLDSTALEEEDERVLVIDYVCQICKKPAQDCTCMPVFLKMGYNKAMAEQHKRIKLAKEELG